MSLLSTGSQYSIFAPSVPTVPNPRPKRNLILTTTLNHTPQPSLTLMQWIKNPHQSTGYDMFSDRTSRSTGRRGCQYITHYTRRKKRIYTRRAKTARVTHGIADVVVQHAYDWCSLAVWYCIKDLVNLGRMTDCHLHTTTNTTLKPHCRQPSLTL